MLLHKRLLNGVQFALDTSHTLDRCEEHIVGLDREHQAGAHSLAIQQNGTAATDAMLTAHVGSRQAQLMAQEVREQQAHRDAPLVALPIDGDGNFAFFGKDRHLVVNLILHHMSPFYTLRLAHAAWRTRLVNSAVRTRRYSTVACTSLISPLTTSRARSAAPLNARSSSVLPTRNCSTAGALTGEPATPEYAMRASWQVPSSPGVRTAAAPRSEERR